MKTTKILSAVLFVFLLTFSACGPKDADIAKAVSDQTSAMGVTATVKDGVVTLTGEAKDDATKVQAETVAKTVKGVKSVVNSLTVTPPPAPVVIETEDPLKKGLADALKDMKTVKGEVNDGVITLTGDIKKAELPKLMMVLNSLKPKKIENKLTVK